MYHSRKWKPDNPGLCVFLLDQSGSMGSEWPKNPGTTKAHVVADCLNNTLSELISRSTGSIGQVSHRCDVAVIGYGRDTRIGSVFQGSLQGQTIVKIPTMAKQYLRVTNVKRNMPDGKGGYIEVEEPSTIWVVPETGRAGTPMRAALAFVHGIVSNWLNDRPNSPAPVVIHITDGESTDGDPTQSAEAIRMLCTNDGEAILVNCHIPSAAEPEVLYPTSESQLPYESEYAKTLFAMSSPLPGAMYDMAKKAGLAVGSESRLMVMNADVTTAETLIQFGATAKM